MFSRVALNLVLVFAFPQLLATQEPPSTVSLIERLAVEAAIARSEVAKDRAIRIVIDPMVVYGDEAPGGRDMAMRDPARQAYLVRSFGAKSLPRQSVLDCTSRPCTMREADLLVTLSEPQVSGNNASVTVTTLRPIRRGTQYITTKVLLRREASVWKVVGLEELGIS